MRVVFTSVLLVLAAIVACAQPTPKQAKLKPPPPPNDSCTNAQVQTGYHWYALGATYGATHQKGELGSAVWYTWTAPAAGPALVRLYDNDPGPRGRCYVYTGTTISSRRFVKPLARRNRSNLLFLAAQGTTYFLSVEKPEPKFSGDSADFTLELLLTTVALTQPTNGAVYTSAEAIPMTMVTTELPSTVASMKFRAEGFPLGYGPILEAPASSLPYAQGGTNLPPGQWNVYGELTRTDGYVLDTASAQIIVRPANDNFADRKVLVGTQVAVNDSVAEATVEPGEPAANTNRLTGSIWYSWTAPGDGYVFIPHIYSPWAEGINVFTGSTLSTLSGPLKTTDAAGNDIPFAVSAGETLQIAVFDVGSLSLTYYGIPANDSFASAIEVAGTNAVLGGNNLAATREPGEPVALGAGGHSLWYTWTAPTNGTLILQDTNIPPFFTGLLETSPLVVSLYTGEEVTNLTAAGTAGLSSPAYFPVWAGTTYQIAVDNSSTNWGVEAFGIQLSFCPAQPNDAFADRAVLTGDDAHFTYTTLGASTEPGEPPMGPNSLWWTWTAPYDGTAFVSGMLYSPVMGYVYTGDSLTNLELVASKDAYFFWNAQAGTTYQIAISAGLPGQLVGLHLHYYTNGTPIEP